jgi:hypothetical protein
MLLIDQKGVRGAVYVPLRGSRSEGRGTRKCGFPAENEGFGFERGGTVRCVWGVTVPWRGWKCEIARENRGFLVGVHGYSEVGMYLGEGSEDRGQGSVWTAEFGVRNQKLAADGGELECMVISIHMYQKESRGSVKGAGWERSRRRAEGCTIGVGGVRWLCKGRFIMAWWCR